MWFGNDDHTPMRKVTGGSLPALAWRNFMLAATSKTPATPLPDAMPVGTPTPLDNLLSGLGIGTPVPPPPDRLPGPATVSDTR